VRTSIRWSSEPAPIRAALQRFEPVPHRLEVVDTVNGVTYVNDSIATTPDRSMAALKAIDEPIVLIAGGRDKRVPMDAWARVISERARSVILVGEAAPLIQEALTRTGSKAPVLRATGFDQTVALAASVAQAGDVVLLAPGCTSFDEFRDYAARGQAFRDAVLSLQEHHA